ncbi:hypothetical protein K438DRAFT_1776399 [Mycena galopus ATCC 62051]|nr:hypothetical protein K438DRAFT_1776399 [Mycena galopus ATCC 62051]
MSASLHTRIHLADPTPPLLNDFTTPIVARSRLRTIVMPRYRQRDSEFWLTWCASHLGHKFFAPSPRFRCQPYRSKSNGIHRKGKDLRPPRRVYSWYFISPKHYLLLMCADPVAWLIIVLSEIIYAVYLFFYTTDAMSYICFKPPSMFPSQSTAAAEQRRFHIWHCSFFVWLNDPHLLDWTVALPTCCRTWWLYYVLPCLTGHSMPCRTCHFLDQY